MPELPGVYRVVVRYIPDGPSEQTGPILDYAEAARVAARHRTELQGVVVVIEQATRWERVVRKAGEPPR